MRKSPISFRLKHSGISLMEVVLALTILGIASAYLAQAMQLASQNAIRSQRMTQAELVAESVMNQVIAGVIPAQPVSWTPYVSSSGTNANWNYMLNISAAEMEGMIGIQIAVQENAPGRVTDGTQVDLLATRWIIDPSLGLDTPPAEEVTEESTTGSTTGQPATGQQGQSAGAGMAGGAGMVGGGGFGTGGTGGFGAGGGFDAGGTGGFGTGGGFGAGGGFGGGGQGGGGGRPGQGGAGQGGGRGGQPGGQGGGRGGAGGQGGGQGPGRAGGQPGGFGPGRGGQGGGFGPGGQGGGGFGGRGGGGGFGGGFGPQGGR